ncbi:synapse-associated protein 1-like [Seriola lalandi dorsalis]|uniref:Synapse-associated protein 1 n=1 Tax=Seriola lalandi dorsalis TaxID=1841481 RepID=A0A3B4Y1Y9_SERLL|nr:synapse-associated protein 1-like [Seriola lalandi dorsalis]XP_056238696.1 synapse-associated protein 1 isoform X1 [Seriola aureovittata]
MFKGLGTWLGLENPTYTKTSDDKENLSVQQEEKVVEAQNEVNKQQPADQDGEPETNLENSEDSKGLGDFIFSFASSATKKISESMVETAQTIKKTVEEGKIDGIIDKTFLGDFQKEQEKFVQEKKAKKSEAAVPPWVGYNEEETIQQQILALSADKRNFLRDPPAGVQFHFDMEQMYPLATVMLEEDQLLNRMRFDLVPKHVKEEVFWRNYFYRVSLIKQSAQLTALAAQQQQKDDEDRGAGVSPEDVVLTDTVRPKTPPVSISDIQKPPQEEEEEMSTSPGVSEFVSDAFDSTAINQEDLRKEMEQLVLDKKESTPSPDDESADWEKELQQELQEYEVVTESDNKDDQWDQEIEKMLQADDS